MLSFPTQIPAERQSGGVCRGTLTLHSKQPNSGITNSTFCYAVLPGGPALHIYESITVHDRGDFPLYIWCIVGASKVTSSSSASSAASSASTALTDHHHHHHSTTMNSCGTVFRLVTNQGTQVDCTVPTEKCRDVWIHALLSGLELSLQHDYLVCPICPSPAPPRNNKHFGGSGSGSGNKPITTTTTARQFFRTANATIRYCKSCGSDTKLPIVPITPLSQFAKSECRQDVCHDCSISQGLWYHLQGLVALYTAYDDETFTHQQARDGCRNVAAAAAAADLPIQMMMEQQQLMVEHDVNNTTTTTTTAMESCWVNVPSTTTTATTVAGTTILLEYVQSKEFLSYCAKSPVLTMHRAAILNGDIDMSEFLERLDDIAPATCHNNSTSSSSGNNTMHHRPGKNVQAELKKQAFQMAGSDMGTAMKLLLEQAFRDDSCTEVLQCVLEFFLKLCDESDLQSVAFFWPQLCQIHLRMLPATNALAATRVDLLEDFLLTVCVNYSIHLALEIVWSHTADLEDSMQTLSTGSEAETGSAIPKKRRFSVLRFLCELESLLFDFEGGWGGGSVTVGKLLKPTPYQVQLLKNSAMQLRILRPRNMLRRRKPHADEAESRRKYNIARNADYFTCHLNFSKRLSDIAEKLRMMEVQERSTALEQELKLLNSSGAMGGDPLNRVRKSLIRVVRLPATEGHVFRSKERTPVLLLMEVINEDIVDKEDAHALASSNATPAASVTTDTDEAASTAVEDKLDETLETSADPVDTADGKLSQVAEIDLILLESNDSDEGEDARLKSSPTSMILEGAEEGYMAVSPGRKYSTHRHVSSTISFHAKITAKALLRFDNEVDADKRGQTPRRDVELLVNSVATVQLREIVMPDISSDCQTADIEEHATNEEQKSQDESTEMKNDKPIEKRGSSSKLTGLSTTGSNDSVGDAHQSLAPTGDIRRAVLTTIMMRGIQGNTIAAGTADSVQRSLKELERRRATELLLSDDDVVVVDKDSGHSGESEIDSTRQRMAFLGLSPSADEAELAARPSEEDEVLESIRLILIQNQVAQGQLSPADAAKVLQHTSLSPINASKSSSSMDFDAPMNMEDLPTIDAGDVDPRLVGCGALPPAILQAMTLWKGGMVSNAELLELVKKDVEFVKHSVLVDAANLDAMKENSAFWARFSFGERWAEKKARIGSSSPKGVTPGWDLMGVIVKSNDDLRQEAFVMQLIELCQEAFELARLELWVSPYRILATGRTTGVIECVRNAMSFDALKKRPGYGKGGLREHLQRMAEFTADPGGAFTAAQQNFVRSLAAYSLISYLFLLKDRHNGNLLLDTAGHVIHIDFGFAFGIAPGGSFSLEMSTPFKLTEEMLDVMGGLRSPLFSEFVTLFCCGFLALQAHCDTFLTIIEITSRSSSFKCFEGRDTEEIVMKMRERLCPDLSKEDTVSFALDLIKQATTSYGTRQYDLYQYLSQGIVA